MPTFGGFYTLFDFNGDGNLDLIRPIAGTLQIEEGAGNFSFNTPKEIEIPFLFQESYGPISFQTADFDLNGLPDLLIQTGRNLTILQNSGQGNFTPIQYAFKGAPETRMVLSDFENDGDLDIVKLGSDYYASINYIYVNKIISSGTVANQAPMPPANLRFSNDKKPVLSWDAASDDKMPASHMSYNLQVINSEGESIFHPETNQAGNFRLCIGPGNAGRQPRYEINSLPAGRYTARVQALDAAGKLSAFSDAVQFEIMAGPENLAIERILLNKIALSWTNHTTTETKLVLERRTLESDFEVIAELPSGATYFTDSLLAYNQIYFYRAYALVNQVPTAGSKVAEWNTQLLVENRDAGLPKVDFASMDVGDYTNDGKMDLVVSGGILERYEYKGSVRAVVENTGRNWVAHPAGVEQMGDFYFEFRDFDGDHQLDLFQYGYIDIGSYQSSVLLNKGNHTFQPTSNLFTTSPQNILGWWDFDADNDVDALTFETNSSGPWKKRLLQNKGLGNFSKVTEEDITCYGCIQQVIPGDFNRDGTEDILQYGYTSEEGSGYYLKLNTDEKLLETGVVITSYGGLQVRVVDYNNDGWLDVFIFAYTLTGSYEKSMLYKNLGTDENGIPHFQKVKDDFASGDRIDCDWADYDHDGDLDLFISGYTFMIYTNEGNDRFSEIRIPSLYATSNKSRWIDYDGDGDLDIYYVGSVIPNYQDSQGIVLVNQLIVGEKGIANQPPTPPTGLSARQDEKGMHLRWEPATDDTTPTAGITYDVILYKDGKAITKAALDPVTGNRQRFESGRSLAGLLLRNMPLGEYTWRVQAVDQRFTGSALSAASSFLYKPDAPRINDTTIYRCNRQVTLTASGQNIEWYSDKELFNKLAAGVFQPQISQTVYVTQSINGVRGIARKVEITLYDQPDKPVFGQNNPVTFCEGFLNGPVYLQAVGTQLRWYSDASLQNLVSTETFLTATASNKSYYVTQTLQECESAPLEIVLKAVKIDAVVEYKNDSLIAAEKEGDLYQWYLDNNPIPGAGKRAIKLLSAGVYTVHIAKQNCWQISAPFTATEDKEQLGIFPNPAADKFSVQISTGNSGIIIKVYNNLGNTVYQATIENAEKNVIQVSCASWQKGIYQIVTMDEKNILSRKKIIIQ